MGRKQKTAKQVDPKYLAWKWEVSCRLRTIREGLDWTQKELAEKSGISQSVISAFEAGRRDMLFLTFAALIDALDVDIVEFFDEQKLRQAVLSCQKKDEEKLERKLMIEVSNPIHALLAPSVKKITHTHTAISGPKKARA